MKLCKWWVKIKSFETIFCSWLCSRCLYVAVWLLFFHVLLQYGKLSKVCIDKVTIKLIHHQYSQHTILFFFFLPIFQEETKNIYLSSKQWLNGWVLSFNTSSTGSSAAGGGREEVWLWPFLLLSLDRSTFCCCYSEAWCSGNQAEVWKKVCFYFRRSNFHG